LNCPFSVQIGITICDELELEKNSNFLFSVFVVVAVVIVVAVAAVVVVVVGDLMWPQAQLLPEYNISFLFNISSKNHLSHLNIISNMVT